MCFYAAKYWYTTFPCKVSTFVLSQDHSQIIDCRLHGMLVLDNSYNGFPLQYFVHVSFHSAPIQGRSPYYHSCLLHMSHNCSIPSSTDVYHSEAFTLVAKVTIIPSAVFIELLISIYAIKFYSTTQSRYGRQCYVWRLYLVKTFHVLALWNILIAIQLFGMIAIALGTLLLIHPQVTIFLLLFLAMILVSLTLCTTYLLYHCQQQRRRRDCNPKDCGTNFLHSVLIITIMGLIVALLAIYEVLLLVQAQIGTGVKGLLLSLLPSFPLSALGWYLKRRSQKKAAAANDEQQLHPMTGEQQLQSTDSNIDVDPLLL